MIELINKIFLGKGFVQVPSQEFAIFRQSEESKKQSYWIIKSTDTLDILELQDTWFESAKKAVDYNPTFDKNASLILLYKADENTLIADIQESIFLIEENPYQFKKLVLIYKQSELEALKTHLTNENEATKIEELLSQENVFQTYKQSHGSFSWQSLIYKLAHKIPFLQLRVSLDHGLASLFEMNSLEIAKKGFSELDQKITEQFGMKTINEIKEMDQDTIINLLILEPERNEPENQ